MARQNEPRMIRPDHPFRQRIVLAFGILIFVGLLEWTYVNWLSPSFDYYGFEYYPPPRGYVVLAWLFSVLPSAWMPLSISRPSQLAYWVLYVTVFIPSMFIPLFIGLNAPSDIVWLMVTFFAGFALVGASYLCRLFTIRPPTLSSSAVWSCFAIVCIVCTFWVAVAFRHNIRIVSFSEIYDLRDAANDVGGGPLLNYSLMWLYGALNPFLLAWGLYYKRPWLFGAGVAGQFLVYRCVRTKASLLSIVFIVGIYLLFRIGRFPFALKFAWGIVALLAGLCLSYLLSGDEPSTSLVLLLFLVFFRSFGLAALVTGQYYYFFLHNPHTFYSHLRVVSGFIQYPYPYPLGTEIGYYFYNSLVDTTAHFWATDGIAALGLPGVLIASLVCALLFWVIDSLAQRHEPRLAALVIFYAAYSLANLSLFTTFLSGGLGLLMVLLYLMPAQKGLLFASSSD